MGLLPECFILWRLLAKHWDRDVAILDDHFLTCRCWNTHSACALILDQPQIFQQVFQAYHEVFLRVAAIPTARASYECVCLLGCIEHVMLSRAIYLRLFTAVNAILDIAKRETVATQYT